MTHMPFSAAQALDLATASDEDLVAAWRSYAEQISYHYADDSSKEWHLARELTGRLREIERAIRDRLLPRPDGGPYLLSGDERIDWSTGDWSPGWASRKRMEARA